MLIIRVADMRTHAPLVATFCKLLLMREHTTKEGEYVPFFIEQLNLNEV